MTSPDPRTSMLQRQYPDAKLTGNNNTCSIIIICSNGTTFNIPLLSPARFFSTSRKNKIPNDYIVFRKLFVLSLKSNHNSLSKEQKYVSILSGWAWRNQDRSARDMLKLYKIQLLQYQKGNATPSASLPYVHGCKRCGSLNVVDEHALGIYALV